MSFPHASWKVPMPWKLQPPFAPSATRREPSDLPRASVGVQPPSAAKPKDGVTGNVAPAAETSSVSESIHQYPGLPSIAASLKRPEKGSPKAMTRPRMQRGAAPRHEGNQGPAVITSVDWRIRRGRRWCRWIVGSARLDRRGGPRGRAGIASDGGRGVGRDPGQREPCRSRSTTWTGGIAGGNHQDQAQEKSRRRSSIGA